jgi:hypothetical protein
MRSLAFAVVFFGALGTSFGQSHSGPFWSLGGYGSILYPATGHAPTTPPGGLTGPYFNFSGQRPVLATPVAAAHPQHRRTTIVPYPVYYGGYGYGTGYGYDPSTGYANGSGDPGAPVVNPNPAPSVVINQNFVPPQANPSVRDYDTDDSADQQQSGLKVYQAPSPRPYGNGPQPQRTSGNDDGATIYLLAFKDHSIVQALGYWMEGSTLHYVSAEHSLNQASLDLIDRDLSQRLNSERGVEFKLPPAR